MLQLPRPQLPSQSLKDGKDRNRIKMELLGRWDLPMAETFVVRNHNDIKLQSSKHVDWLRVWFLDDQDLYFMFSIDRESACADLEVTTIERLPLTNCFNHRKALFESKCLVENFLYLLDDPAMKSAPRSISYPREALKQKIKSFVTLPTYAARNMLQKFHKFIQYELEEFADFYGIGLESYQDVSLLGEEHQLTFQAASIFQDAKVDKRLALAKCSLTGRGVSVHETIAAGTPLVVLPEKKVLSLYSALRDPVFGAVAATLLGGKVEVDGCWQNAWRIVGEQTKENIGVQGDPQEDMMVVEPEVVLLLYVLYQYALYNGSEEDKERCNYQGLFTLLPRHNERTAYQKNLLEAPKKLLEEVLILPMTGPMALAMRQKLKELHRWCFPRLTKLWPEVFHKEHFSFEFFVYGKWILESREFEVEIPLPQDLAAGGEIPQIHVNLYDDLKAEKGKLNTTHRHPLLPKLRLLHPYEADPYAKPECRTVQVNNVRYKLNLPRKIICIMPVVDMFNHHPAGQCGHPYVEMGEGGELQMVLRNEITLRPGTEAYVSYGPHESWELIRYYGFCPRRIICDTTPRIFGVGVESKDESCDDDPYPFPSSDNLRLVFAPPESAIDRQAAEKMAFIEQRGIPMEHILRGPRTFPCISSSLWECLQVLLASLDDASYEWEKGSEPHCRLLTNHLIETLDITVNALNRLENMRHEPWYKEWSQRAEVFLLNHHDLILFHLNEIGTHRLADETTPKFDDNEIRIFDNLVQDGL